MIPFTYFQYLWYQECASTAHLLQMILDSYFSAATQANGDFTTTLSLSQYYLMQLTVVQ